jgi:predicted AAA+ superfamily ATPase
MPVFSDADLFRRIAVENPWWADTQSAAEATRGLTPRRLFDVVLRLTADRTRKDIPVIVGPRQTGKTVLIRQVIARLIAAGAPARSIVYLSLKRPAYTGAEPEEIIQLYLSRLKTDVTPQPLVIFDDVHYLKDWREKLTALVEKFPTVRVLAASTLGGPVTRNEDAKSDRTIDLALPPLSFQEFLTLRGAEEGLFRSRVDQDRNKTMLYLDQRGVVLLNEQFMQYLNLGGFPEVAADRRSSAHGQADTLDRISDALLASELPGRSGIQDTREMQRLFSLLAWQTGDEFSIDGLAQAIGVAKNTLKRHLDYLESAGLIRRTHRLDEDGNRFQRAVTFKVHLTAPTMRAALFGPVGEEDPAMTKIAETAVIGQYLPDPNLERVMYARWTSRNIDIVVCDPASGRPKELYEIIWNETEMKESRRFNALTGFRKRNEEVSKVQALTQTTAGGANVSTVDIRYLPVAAYCYWIGKQISDRLSDYYLGPGSTTKAQADVPVQAAKPRAAAAGGGLFDPATA